MEKLKGVLLLFLLFTSFHLGQTSNPVQLYLGGGIEFPVAPSDFKDYWNMGFDGVGGVGIKLNNTTSVFVTLGYGAFALNEDKIMDAAGVPSGVNPTIDGGSANGLSIDGSARLLLMTNPGSASPYLIASAGYYSLSIEDVTVKASYMGSYYSYRISFEKESAFSASFGAGVDIPISNTASVFIEARYFTALTEGESTSIIPVNAGVIIGF